MTLHQLRIFSAVASRLNVTTASWDLHISQPSVSQQLKLLEEELGLKLHRRISGGIELTEKGWMFLQDIEPILLRVEAAEKRFKNKNNRKTGFLAVGGNHSQSVYFLPLVLAVFKESGPDVQLTLRTDRSRALEQLVLKHELELAVITNPSHSPSLQYEPCRREEWIAFVPITHPLAERQELTLAQLALAPLIFNRGKGDKSKVWQTLKQVEERGFDLNIVMGCESSEAVKAAVKAGMGLGVLHRDHVTPEIRRGELKNIKIQDLDMHVDSLIIYHKERVLSPNAHALLTLLRQWPQKMRGLKSSLQAA